MKLIKFGTKLEDDPGVLPQMPKDLTAGGNGKALTKVGSTKMSGSFTEGIGHGMGFGLGLLAFGTVFAILKTRQS